MIECSFFGEGARFHHVGLAVESIQTVSSSAQVFVDKTRGVSMAFVLLNGIQVELLEPLDERSPIARSLQEGVKLLHLCYEVPDLEACLALCRPAGFHCIGHPTPAPALDNRRTAWVYSKHYGLFELLEADPVRRGEGWREGKVETPEAFEPA